MSHLESTSSGSSTLVASDNGKAQAEARAAVTASLEVAGSHYDSRLQQRASDIHANSKVISKQEADVKKQTAALAKESAKLQKEVNKANKAVNEIGDVQNWAETLERSFLVLEETLRLVEGDEEAQTASGGSTWRLF